MASNNPNDSNDLTFTNLSGIGLTDSLLNDLEQQSFYRYDGNGASNIPQHGYMHQHSLLMSSSNNPQNQQTTPNSNVMARSASTITGRESAATNTNSGPTSASTSASSQLCSSNQPSSSTPVVSATASSVQDQSKSVVVSTPKNNFYNMFHPSVQTIIRGKLTRRWTAPDCVHYIQGYSERFSRVVVTKLLAKKYN